MRKGWEMKRLEDVCEKASSNIAVNKIENDNGDYPIYGASGFLKKVSFYHQEKPYIGIIKDGAGVGRFSLLEAYSSVIGTLQYLIPNGDIDIRYFHYFLMGIDFSKYINGSTIPHIYFKDYKEEPFLYVPISEQQQIVTILNEAFATIDQAKENLQRNLQNVKELFQSELNKLFENKGEDWNEKLLEEVTSKIGSGATPRGGNESYKTEGISLIRSMNVHDRFFKEKNLAFIDDKQAKELSNVTLEGNDVLLNITGASVARCCVIPKEYLPARVNQHVSILRPKKEIVDSYFLNLLLVSKFYKDQLLETGDQGSTRQAITKAQLQNFTIHFPSLKEQKKIVNQLHKLSIQTEALEDIYQKKLDTLEELKKSILQKAFSGELTIKRTAVA